MQKLILKFVKILQCDSLNWKKSLFFVSFAIIFINVIRYLPVGNFLNFNLDQMILFSFRNDLLHRYPKFNPKLKVFTLDDLAVAEIHSYDLSLTQWAILINEISKRNPEAIFIDKIFGLIDSETKEAENFVKGLEKATPVYVGSFISSTAIPGRERFAIQRDKYKIASLLSKESENGELQSKDIKWLVRKNGFFYGPELSVLRGFAGVGQINYFGSGGISAYISSEKDYAVPHLGLLAAKKIELDQTGIDIDGRTVSLGSDGLLPVNYFPKKEYFANSKGLKGTFKRIQAHKQLDDISSGDYVVILPRMYTGNDDLKDTPVGSMPGGFILVTVINSVLNGDWLIPKHFAVASIFLIAFICLILGAVLPNIILALLAIFIPIFILCISALIFSYLNIVVSWVWPAFTAFVILTAFSIERFRQTEKRSRLLNTALKRAVPANRLKHILMKPEMVKYEATEKIVSVIFIDVVGFSISAESQTPVQIFDDLKKLLGMIRRIIHDHGGVVDKTLGDGVLGFFGYDYIEQKENKNGNCHADQALRAAIEIQTENLKRCIENKENRRPVYPLRIGINTASVYIGDLGDESAVDFTLIGHGVNFAKRLESGCEVFKILMSATTKDLLASVSSRSEELKLKYIKIKHYSEPVEAYEYNPFTEEGTLLKEAENAYKQYSGLKRLEPRWPVSHERTVILSSEKDQGRLVDFSLNGFSVELNNYYASGIELQLLLNINIPSLTEKLEVANLSLIVGEVRWGRINGEKYIHGMLIKNFTQKQKEQLNTILRETLTFIRYS